MADVPPPIKDPLVGASPPLYLQQMLAASAASSKRQRSPTAERCDVPISADGAAVLKGDLVSMMFDLERHFCELLSILAAAPPPYSHEEEEETDLRAQQLREGSARWMACVSSLQHGIRSQGTVCVKRALRDQLAHEIAERERAINKMTAAIAIAKQTL